MQSSITPYEINIYRWGTIFATLSLDVAAPFISQMGLQLPAGNGFRMGLRKIIEEFRKLEGEQSNAESLFSSDVFDWAANEFGRGFAEHLYAWGQDVFQSGDIGDEGAFIWNSIVRRGGLNGARDTHPPLLFVSGVRTALAKRARAAVNYIQPDSDWDLSLYQRQKYDEFRNPMELVQATISHFDFVHSWQEAITNVGQPDIPQLMSWAIKEANMLGIPLDYVVVPGNWLLPPPFWS